MDSKNFSNINRRDFVKYMIMAAGAATLPGATSGCATLGKNVPKLDYSKKFIFTNCNVIDVVTGKITKKASIIVINGKIRAIERGLVDKAPDSVVINLDNKYVTPGLIDGHGHPTMAPVFGMKQLHVLKYAKQMKQNFISSVETGITTIRDMGAFSGLLRYFTKGIENGEFPGPRVTYCNSMLNIIGSHPELPLSEVSIFAAPASLLIGMVMDNFRDTEELQKCLKKNAKGASFVKLTLDNKTLFCKKNKEIPVYTDEQLEIVFKFAAERGLPVAGHHHYEYGLERALQYPIDSVEHIVADTVLSDKNIQKMKDKNVSIVPTLVLGQSFLMEEAFDKVPKEYRTEFIDNEQKIRNEYFRSEAYNHCDPALHKSNLDLLKDYKKIGWDGLWAKNKFLVNPHLYYGMMKNGTENLMKMKEAGVLIGCGIDAGLPFSYFGGMYREYEIYSRIGFSNLEVLQSATINNAKILKMEDQIGSVEAGKFADLVVYDKNPLDNIKTLRTPSQVYKEGKMMFSRKDLLKDGKIIS